MQNNLLLKISFLNPAKNKILNNINLEFKQGSITALLGQNGAGKSSILKAIFSLIPGKYDSLVGSMNLSKLSEKERSKIISYNETNNLEKPQITSLEFLRFSEASDDELEEAMKIWECEHLKNRYVNTLSEGEFKRICLILGISQKAEWYLFDEPEQNLDPRGLQIFYDEIEKLNQVNKKSIILTSHDLRFACSISDTFIGLKDDQLSVLDKKESLESSGFLEDIFDTSFLYEQGQVVGPEFKRELRNV